MSKGNTKQLAVVREELEALMERIKANHRNAGQVASGRTERSMHVAMTESDGTLYGRAYFGVLETGRRAGRVPLGFQYIILQWMKDKGIHGTPMPYKRKPSALWQPKFGSAQERGDYSLASAIANSIRKRGTKLYRNGGRTDIFSNEIQVTTENIMRRLLVIFGDDITSETLKKTSNARD